LHSPCDSFLPLDGVMFVGHYGLSYAGKAIDQRIPLWTLFIAVQLLDVFWGIFVLLGIERVRIVPGITATNPLDLYYMPYTHSLLAALGWSIAAAFAYWIWRERTAPRQALVIGAAVLSHWVLDFLVHRPDLPLLGNQMKVGLGLWNSPAVAFALEAVFLFAGLLWYMHATRRSRRGGAAAFVLFSLALLGVQAITFFGAPPTSAQGAALTALVAYLVLAGIAAWLEARTTRGIAEAAPA
jgi:hypothetical protein